MRLFAILFSFALMPAGVQAQIIPVLESPLEIQVTPSVPVPGQTVTLTAANVTDTHTATFTWAVDGRVVTEGIGANRITVRAGSVGSRTVVTVTATRDGESIGTDTYALIPGELDLVWEARTYTPPFYAGRPVPTGDSLVTIAAIPSAVVGGVRLSASTLSYQWYLNGSQTPYRTGYGLSSITIAPPLFDSAFSVRVVATTQDGSFALHATEVIAPQTPDIVLYQKHPLLGVLFNHELSTRIMLSDEEVTLRLFPLFTANIGDGVYTWRVNSTAADTRDAPRELTLRKTGSGVGRANIQVAFEVEDSLYERAERALTLTF